MLRFDHSLELIHIGDSFLYFFDDTGSDLEYSLADENAKNERLFFRLSISSDLKVKIDFNHLQLESKTIQNITKIVACSDGINYQTQMLLKAHFGKIEEKIRPLVASLPQRTYDDKTLMFIELV